MRPRHRRGTHDDRRLAAQPQARYVHSLSSLADLFQFALSTHYEIVGVESVALSEDRAALVGGEAGSTWNLIKGVRRMHAGGEVVCYIHSYIPKRLSRLVGELPGCVGPFYALLSKRAREDIIEADQEIRGEPMTREMARALGRKPGDPSICALRRYTSAKGTLITSFNWHIAENFLFQMKLQKNL